MNSHTQNALRFLSFSVAAASLTFALQGCIKRDDPVDSGGTTGSTTGGGTTGGETTGGETPGACAKLPAATTSYKGGDALGEELTLTLNPTTLAYTITVDASVQRSAGSTRSGTLTALDTCTYSSGENGAIFTVGSGGIVQGGIAAPTGSSFAAAVAFATTFENSATPTVFNPVAAIYDVIGVQGNGSASSSYGSSGRLRNAGTFQLCVASASGGFMIYDAACTQTAKGYVTWNATRKAFDLFTTDPAGGAVTTGGTLTGSMVIGLVDSVAVPLQLVRESATSYGLRLYAPQAALASGTADGSYLSVDSAGGNAEATLAGASLTRGGSTATLAYDSPVLGVVQASGTLPGYLLYNSGVYGFVPSAGSGAAFELGIRN
ncbi:MAG: hypothetical protein ACREVL_06480 [Solimonas sp.]